LVKHTFNDIVLLPDQPSLNINWQKWLSLNKETLHKFGNKLHHSQIKILCASVLKKAGK